MARPISSVHVDIARLGYEIAQVPDGELGGWLQRLHKCLALRDPTIHEYGAFLLSEVDEYRKADLERKKGKTHSKDSGDSVDSTERQPRTDQIRTEQDPKQLTLSLANGSLVEVQKIFEEARKAYPGTKRGFETEWKDFIRKHGKNGTPIRELVGKLLPAIEAGKAHKKALEKINAFVPNWKNLKTWLGNSCWEEEFPKEVYVEDKRGR